MISFIHILYEPCFGPSGSSHPVLPRTRFPSRKDFHSLSIGRRFGFASLSLTVARPSKQTHRKRAEGVSDRNEVYLMLSLVRGGAVREGVSERMCV